MTRNLETLIQEFNQLSELDRLSRISTGESCWHEVDGIHTNLVNSWFNELTIQEKLIFEAHLSEVIDSTALGFESWQQHIKDVGQKIFSDLKMGINTS